MKGFIGTIATAICLFLSTQAVAATQYEAENAALSGSAAKNTNHAGYTGSGFVDGYFNSATAQISFTVSAVSAGSTTLTLRYSAGNGTSTNTGLYVNGAKIKNVSCAGTANWDTWANETETVTLIAGNNTIAYKAESSSSSSINVDNLIVQGSTTLSLSLTNDSFGSTSPAGAISVNAGTPTPITATPAANYKFSNWTVVSGTAAIANPSSASTTVTLTSGNAVLRANFVPMSCVLTLTNDGGGSTTPTGTVTTNCGSATPITATAATGFQFANWTVVSGTASLANPASASTSVTLPGAPATIRANYTGVSSGTDAVTYAEISSPVTVTASNSVVLALPFTAPASGYITVTATGLYGTNNPYSDEQRGLESFITLNSVSGGSLSGFSEKMNQAGSAQYVSETAGFQVAAGSNTVRLIVSPRTTLTATSYKFVKCRMTVVFSTKKM